MLIPNNPMIDLVKENKIAVLSSDYKGTPFGSLTPYALDEGGNPIIYVSDLAVHTTNINKNSKASITISKIDEENIFNSARITLLGKMKKTNDEKIVKIYYDKYKQAESFSQFADFSFYVMEIESIYYVGGFGDINWIDIEEYRKQFIK